MMSVHRQRLTVGLALALASLTVQAAGPVFKCVVNGTVTFQSVPCPSDKPVRHPTKDELNAERKKRLSEAPPQPAAVAPAAPSSPAPEPRATDRPPQPVSPRDQGFRCDGRQYCTQMRSCTEAKFFLANCPGVKMDGNHDGVPCEQQWCTSPLAK
jgi:hypothetical protein